MPTFYARVREDGSVVLPDELRAQLDLKPGSEVEFFLTVDGQVHFHHLTDQFTSFGVQVPKPPMSIREMDDIIADSLAEKHAPRTSPQGRTKRPAAE